MAKQNIMSRASAYRKKHPGVTMPQAVKIVAAADRKTVSGTKTSTAMATRKKRATPRKKTTHRRVSGVGRTTTTVRKTSTKRKQIGAIVDRHMFYLAGGMALKSVVNQMLIDPLMKKVPAQFAMFIEPAKMAGGYYASKRFKNPVIQGVALAIMGDGVEGTVKLVLGKIPMLQAGVTKLTNGMSGDMYYQLPAPNMGEIKNYLGAIGEIPQFIGNINNSPMPNMGDIDPADEIILPLGYDK